MTSDATNDAQKTLSVPTAGWLYFDLSRGAAYAAAARGDIPTIRIGRKLRVPIVAIERLLERSGKGDDA
jgi:Helix-turn-helix domain